MAAVTRAGLATAYDRAADAWAQGPDRLYGRLADALVASCPPLSGRRVLDVGAGTGALSRAVRAAGGEVVATDLAVGMLAHGRANRPPAVAADALALPFPAAVFDAVLAGFVLNHLPDPGAALHEARRVATSGGLVAAATFDGDWQHPAKAAVDAAAARFGHTVPDWYVTLKTEVLPDASDPAVLVDAAEGAGLVEVEARRLTVDGGLETPEQMVAWRLGMAHLAPFVAELPAPERRRLVAAAVTELGPTPPPVRPDLVVLTARAP